MLADDAFRSRLQVVIAELRRLADGLGDVATVDAAQAPDHYHLAVRPHAAAACPLELILHHDQRFDIVIGEETYEARPIEDLALFPALLTAIAAGRVLTRTWTTPATGAQYSVETLVFLEERVWRDETVNAAVARVAARDDCVAHDRHCAPYRAR
jgi:hypothetical protein